jgi:hypothetical protein
VRQTVRFPKEVHDAIMHLAAGSEHRPPSSFNQTLMFVVRAGLAALKRAERSENEPGQWVPAGLDTVEA